MFECVAQCLIFQFGDGAARPADEELGSVVVVMAGRVAVGAADEGGQALDPVDEAVLDQEVQRAVDCRRGGARAADAELGQKVVRADGPWAVEHEGEDLAAERGEAGAPAFTHGRGVPELGYKHGRRVGVWFGGH